MPTDNRMSLSSSPAFLRSFLGIDACVITAGNSTRDSTPPRLSAILKIRKRDKTRYAAVSPPLTSKDTMPLKPSIWEAAMSCPGWSGRPG